MTDEMITWIRAQLDTRERVARAADVKQGDPEWWVNEVTVTGGRHFTVRSRRDMRPIARVERLDGDDDEPAGILDGAAVAEHIAFHDPARVLAEVAAKRAIIDRAELVWQHSPSFAEAQAWRHVVRFVGVAYADQPGYLDEWRP